MASKKNCLRKGENLTKRSKRYARELKSGKSEITGKPLTNGQRRFRSGVLNERSISAEQHVHKADAMARQLYGKCYADLNDKQKQSVSKCV